jgi:formylglycine-generating enzyme required for sulfatase activity
VGSYDADTSPFGCMDMAGNVREWTADLFGFYPTLPEGEARAEPPAPFGADRTRVVRGGMYDLTNARLLESLTTYRGHGGAEQRYPHVGFRVALSAN